MSKRWFWVVALASGFVAGCGSDSTTASSSSSAASTGASGSSGAAGGTGAATSGSTSGSGGTTNSDICTTPAMGCMQAMGSAGGFCHEARDITTGDPIEMKAECEDPMSETAGVWLAEGCPRTDVSCGWVVTVGGGQVEKLTLAYFPDQVPLAMACQGGSAIGAELCTSAGFAYP